MTPSHIGRPDEHAVAALRELSQWSEDAAARSLGPAVLAGLLDRSGHAFHLAEDFRGAARLWTRARDVNRIRARSASDDPDTAAQVYADQVAVLVSLSQLFHRTDRPQQALESELELALLHHEANEKTAEAHALARAGTTLLTLGRHDDAERRLADADRMFQSFDPANATLAQAHARVLEQLATLHRHQGRPGEARRCERRAVEVAAAPLVPKATVIRELSTTAATMASQLSTFGAEIATVAGDVVNQRQPQLAGLAKVPGVIDIWCSLADGVNLLAERLVQQVDTVAAACGRTRQAEANPTAFLEALDALVEWMAHAAIRQQAQETLIGLLDRGAQVYRLVGDFGRAEAQWVRALRLSDDLVQRTKDLESAASPRARSIQLLESRSDLYGSWGQFGLDTAIALIEEHRAAGDAPSLARAQAHLGSRMLTAKDYEGAEVYLTKADAEFQALGKLDSAMSSAHAIALELLASVHLRHDHHIRANRCRRRALAIRAP